MKEWECPCGPYHIPDFVDVGICLNCGLIHVFCENCGKMIDSRELSACPKETRLALFKAGLINVEAP